MFCCPTEEKQRGGDRILKKMRALTEAKDLEWMYIFPEGTCPTHENMYGP
jgi:hypothetical protein